eukprot:TRINITY_DN33240_c0_g1_i1.p1 TRINITY_DN33240_c0_g1~~TRINITY_DN33240_c0_g1_i1.p1  ORF type:complete len:291 (+),score=27.14 TRINITY_DN33240_c0_g1_i1:50-922(+)
MSRNDWSDWDDAGSDDTDSGDADWYDACRFLDLCERKGPTCMIDGRNILRDIDGSQILADLLLRFEFRREADVTCYTNEGYMRSSYANSSSTLRKRLTMLYEKNEWCTRCPHPDVEKCSLTMELEHIQPVKIIKMMLRAVVKYMNTESSKTNPKAFVYNKSSHARHVIQIQDGKETMRRWVVKAIATYPRNLMFMCSYHNKKMTPKKKYEMWQAEYPNIFTQLLDKGTLWSIREEYINKAPEAAKRVPNIAKALLDVLRNDSDAVDVSTPLQKVRKSLEDWEESSSEDET